MDLFLNTFTNRIDRKGRVSVPADFRAVLNRRGSASLILYPAVGLPAIEGASEDFLNAMLNKIEAFPLFSAERENLTNSIMPFVRRVGFDGEGRIVLPADLIAESGARLDDVAVFVGRGFSFQIWREDEWSRRAKEARAQASQLWQKGRRP
jgi:MraZ protein